MGPGALPRAMMGRLAFAAVAVLAVGGQLDAFLPVAGRPLAVASSSPPLPGEPASWLDLGWPADGRLECPVACRLQVPGPGDLAEGLDLWVTWDGTRTRGFAAALGGQAGWPAFDAVDLGRVAGGETLRLWGNGSAELVLVPAAGGVPNLAALVPASLGQPLPSGGVAGGCLAEEEALGMGSCLRFTTGVANLGDAPLALASGLRSGEQRMTQSLPGGDRLAGTAAYHASHGHFHYARFIAFGLHRVDPATGLRGEAVLRAEKTGFCMVDFGEVAQEAPLARKTYWRDGCEPHQRELEMGLNPGWYDIYRWFLPEQALDVAGLPDGTYELVVTVDPDGTLTEAHTLDNRASVVFGWQDGHAQPLEGHGLYFLSPQPS